MLTAQNVKDKTFEKAVFGGYDMGGVDQFMDEVAESITALQKENAVLKSKMKVLVDKIEEYRSTEDAMRLALLSAQKMSVQIENEAKEKREAMLSDATRTSEDLRLKARSEADRMIRDARNAIATQKAKINAAQRSSAEYIERMKTMCQKQMDFLNSLDDYQLPDPEPERDPEMREAVRSAEETLSKKCPGKDREEQSEGKATQERISAADEPTQLFDISKLSSEKEEGTKKFSFEDLRFSNDD
jgi:cell division initiation protein